jgi:hypothetical protein
MHLSVATDVGQPLCHIDRTFKVINKHPQNSISVHAGIKTTDVGLD